MGTDLQELTAGLQSFLEIYTYSLYVLIFLSEKNSNPEVKFKTAYMSPLFSSTYKRILEPMLNNLVPSLVMAPDRPWN